MSKITLNEDTRLMDAWTVSNGIVVVAIHCKDNKYYITDHDNYDIILWEGTREEYVKMATK